MLGNLFGRPKREPWLVSEGVEILREKTPPNKAFARWQEYRADFPKTGLWPTLVSAKDAAHVEEVFQYNLEGQFEEIDVEEFLARRREDLLPIEEEEEFEIDFDFDAAGLVEEKKPPVEKQVFALSRADSEPFLALIPCRVSWMAPFVRGFGNWNDCPAPHEHAAVLKHWNTRHGAEAIVIGHDTIELLVRPITDREEAKRIAIEQYCYCPDIVDQGCGTIEALASTLLGASSWFFWWD